MRSIKTFLICAVVVLMAGAVAVAQDQGGRRRGRGGQRGGNRRGGTQQITRILQGLDLTEEQTQKIEVLGEDLRKKGQEAREAMRGMREKFQNVGDDQEARNKLREEMRTKMAPLREANDKFVEDVKGVLNEEQLKKFNEALDRGNQARTRFRGAREARELGVPAGALEELALTDEQKEKLKALVEAKAEEQRQLDEKYAGLIKQLLTPEQQKVYEKALADEKERRARMRGGNRRGGGRRRRPAAGGDAPAPGDN